MRYQLLLSIYFLLLSLQCFGQKEAENWYFNDQAGLNFSSGSPVVLLNGALPDPADGCTVASDTSGNLLFYSDGVSVWNRNHVLMNNGTGLSGHLSASQTVVAVPKPGSNTIYYVFTVDAIENNLLNGLRYSVIDMNLANGLGAVTAKNILMETPVTENLTATKHANGVDYWIISHRWNSNSFVAYLLTASGVSANPVVSNAGINISGSLIWATGILKASPDGTKLAQGVRASSSFQLLDFNKNTGIASNAIISPSTYSGPFGVEFSNDGTKLYGSDVVASTLYQFDLTVANPFSARVFIGNTPFRTTDLQNAPNGKIYCSQRDSYYLGVINFPNAQGVACNFVGNSVYLGGRKNWFGLPNFPTNIFHRVPPINNFNFSFSCSNYLGAFSIPGLQPGMTVSWNFGDPSSGVQNTSTLINPNHLFSSPGTYTVTLSILTNGIQDIITKTIIVNPLPVVSLGNDISLCPNQTAWLGQPSLPGYSYLWNNGHTQSNLLVNASGTYILTATLNGCTAVDSIKVFYKTPLINDLGGDTVLCAGNSIVIGSNPVSGYSYKWNNGITTSTLLVNTPGTYILEVASDGCIKTDTIKISYNQSIINELGADTSLCKGETILLGKPPVQGYNYKWQDGSTNSTFLVNSPGNYKLEVIQNGCTLIDSVEVNYKDPIEFSLGNDTTLCEGESIVIGDTSITGASYTWQDGSTNATFFVDKAGLYILEINRNGCYSVDSIRVSYFDKPKIDLGPDRKYCIGDQVILGDFPIEGLTYKWQDGINTSKYEVIKPGLYTLKIYKNGCQIVEDEVEISFEDCTLYIPNIITPDQDGLNDNFSLRGLKTEEFQLQIYNRWGVQIYETKSYKNDWDAKDVSAGVYYYLLKNNKTSKSFKGWLEVVK